MKTFNIIEAVNMLDDSIQKAKEEGLSTYVEIDVTRSNNKAVVSVHGLTPTGSNYSSLELHIEDDNIVYWENIPVGHVKDLLPNYTLLH